MRITLSFLAGMALLLAAPVAALAQHDPQHGEQCTDGGQTFACGEILVRPSDPELIDEIVARQGGDPETDILEQLVGETWFVIAVEVGTEAASVESYAADPDVAEAELNLIAETAQPTATPAPVPDAATAPPAPVLPLAMLLAGVASLLVLGSLALRLPWRR